MKTWVLDDNFNVINTFEQQVKDYPHNIAILDKSLRIPYVKLHEKANQIAHYLQKNQVHSGDVVGILLNPGADFITAMLAIIKIGAVYLPLDTHLPPSQLNSIIEDVAPKIMIINSGFGQSLLNKKLIKTMRAIKAAAARYPKEFASAKIAPNSPLYMMYTSGSTGKPKGVLISHQAVVNLSQVRHGDRPIQHHEVVAQFNNLAFDASTYEIWGALLNGATLNIVPKNIKTNTNKLSVFFLKNPVDYLILTTAYFHQLIKSFINSLDNIPTIIFGGEQINLNLLKQFINYRKQLQKPITLINGYGPTEATTLTCRNIITEGTKISDDILMSIGKPIQNVKTYILNQSMEEDLEGELYISGLNLALGYHHGDDQNKEKFIPNPFSEGPPFDRLYKTGDKVRLLPSGDILYQGRFDDQVKIGGFRIHLNEIENKLMTYPNISLAAVTVEEGAELHKMLKAFIVLSDKTQKIHAEAVRNFLSKSLSVYKLPSKYILVEQLPLTPVGKIDKNKLDHIPHVDLSFHIDESMAQSVTISIQKIWCHLLNRKTIDVHKNFFDLGANSLLIAESCALINRSLQAELHIADILSHPTIYKLSRYLEGNLDTPFTKKQANVTSTNIAIIGMSGRFPKANSLEDFWNNICHQINCLDRFNPHSKVSGDKNDVPLRGILADIEYFDAGFFGFNPADASMTDPQHRLFLECAWEALEHAGVAPGKLSEKIISVFAGMTDSTYLQEHLLKNKWFLNEHEHFQQRISSSVGMLSTQLSYRLNLKGRSVNINTACSTGLMAVDHACQDLLLGHSDIAIAGAVSIITPQEKGYSYQEGSILSAQGSCMPFSEKADGTVFSNGLGVVILKRLEDAISENDTIYAVIQGRGVNNDGSDKLGYTAPSHSGQMACILSALEESGLSAEDITYVEAHGTATHLGDLVEFNALCAAFKTQTKRKNFCALGTVKSNIGHSDVAAGMAGLIKTVLSLYHKYIPPMPVAAPNQALRFDKSPFFLNQTPIVWDSSQPLHHAGVSSFGIGGTNIHMILSEHRASIPNPEHHHSEFDGSSHHLIVLSAKTQPALEQMTAAFIQHASEHTKKIPDYLERAALTLQTGREDFAYRRYGLGQNLQDIIQSFTTNPIRYQENKTPILVVFMFPGEGMDYATLAQELMIIPYFEQIVREGATLASEHLSCDFLAIMQDTSIKTWHETRYAQPALFIIEYALAKLLMHYGIQPYAMIGHHSGEYVAACLAGVFSFEQGVYLICQRAMLMPPITESFRKILSNIRFHPPSIPMISHISGDWLSDKDAMDLDYWYQPMIETVRFNTGLKKMLQNPASLFIEIGPKRNLSLVLQSLIRQGADQPSHQMMHTLDADTVDSALKQLYAVIAVAWVHGTPILWEKIHRPNQQAPKINLPTYAFQKQKYWLEPDVTIHLDAIRSFVPAWTHHKLPQSMMTSSDVLKNMTWIIIQDEIELGKALIFFLQNHGVAPILVRFGSDYLFDNLGHYTINPNEKDHYLKLVASIKRTVERPIFLNLASFGKTSQENLSIENMDDSLKDSFYSLLYLSQALVEQHSDQVTAPIIVLTSGTQKILGHESINPLNATLFGACKVIAQEHPTLAVKLIDLDPHEVLQPKILYKIIQDAVMQIGTTHPILNCYRNGYQWNLNYSAHKPPTNSINRLKDHGVYLFTGGLGGIALTCCEAIAESVSNPTCILVCKNPVPLESEWTQILTNINHPHHKSVQQLQRLQDLGAQLHIVQIDVTELEPLKKMVENCMIRYGNINAVIHTAGVFDPGLMLFKTKASIHKVLAPKVLGTFNLIKAFESVSLDFVVLTSSLSVLLGGFEQVDYAAANAYLDAVAAGDFFPNASHILSINWNTWRDVGMAAKQQKQGKATFIGKHNDISPEEGKKLFLQMLQVEVHQVAISKIDINTQQDNPNILTSSTPNIERTHLSITNDYKKPRNKIETKLVRLWQETLGIADLGIHDNFFSLGGHSLQAISLIKKINQALDCSLPSSQIYHTATIEDLSALISGDHD